MRTFTFYLRIFPDGKVYVGCTSRTAEVRAGKKGIQYASQPVYKAIQEFGWDSVVTEILEIRDCDVQTATAIECAYIKEYRSDEPEFGYNSPAASSYHSPGRPLNKEACAKIGNSKLGRIWCYKGDDLRFVTEDEWQVLEKEGYQKGFTERALDRRRKSLLSLTTIRKADGTLRRVQKSELDNYLKLGWILGTEYQELKEAEHHQEVLERQRARAAIPRRFILMDGAYRLVAADVAEELTSKGLAIYAAPKHTEAVRKKIVEASKKNWSNPEYRKKFHRSYESRFARFKSMRDDPTIAKKRADAIRANHQTPEYKAKASKALKGRVWITNGTEAKTIKPEELTRYLEEGWCRGRKLITKED